MDSAESGSSGKYSAWSSRPFRWTFAALTVSMLGSEVTNLAVPLVAALTLHASPVQMGLLAGAARLPTFLVSLFAGVFVDRMTSKRRLMIIMDIIRSGLLLLIPASLLIGALSLPLLYTVAFLVGVGTVVHEVAQNAFIPSVVAKIQLLDGNAKLQVSYSAGESVGPGLGGVLVQFLTAPIAVIADAASYLASAILLGRVRDTPLEPQRTTTNTFQDVKDGLRALLKDRLLGPWVRWGAVSVVLMGAFEAQYLLFASRELHLNPAVIGLIAATGGLGAIPAAMLISRLSRRVPVGKSIIVALMGYFAFLTLVPAARGPVPVIVVALVVAKVGQSFAFTISNVQQWSLRQLVTGPELLGRVSAANRFLIGSAETIGAVGSGLIVELLGLRALLALCGVVGILVLTPLVRRPLWTLARLPDQTGV